jgi:hypothetical protein
MFGAVAHGRGITISGAGAFRASAAELRPLKTSTIFKAIITEKIPNEKFPGYLRNHSVRGVGAIHFFGIQQKCQTLRSGSSDLRLWH